MPDQQDMAQATDDRPKPGPGRGPGQSEDRPLPGPGHPDDAVSASDNSADAVTTSAPDTDDATTNDGTRNDDETGAQDTGTTGAEAKDGADVKDTDAKDQTEAKDDSDAPSGAEPGEEHEQEYVNREGLDFDPEDGLYTGTAVDGGTKIPGPHDQVDDVNPEDQDDEKIADE